MSSLSRAMSLPLHALALTMSAMACGVQQSPLLGFVPTDAVLDVTALPDADTAVDASDASPPLDAGQDATPVAADQTTTDENAADQTAADQGSTDKDTDSDATAADADLDAALDAQADLLAADQVEVPDVAVIGDVQASDTSPDSATGPDSADAGPAPTCSGPKDCSGAKPYCSPAGACVACNFHIQCPGEGALCLDHLCKAAVSCVSDKECTPFGAVCDAANGMCRECISAADCAKGQVCKANQCQVPQPCQSSKECPGLLVCTAGQCAECGADADCLAEQFCNQNVCSQDVCAPGAHCEGNNLLTCKANGSGWDSSACGTKAVCLGAACAAIVCTPLEVSCQAGGVSTCNSTGTATTLAPCPANQTCVAGVCTSVVCAAGSKSCDEQGNVLVCNGNGTQWLPSPCPSNSACSAGTCAPKVCTPGQTTCNGQQLMTCTNLGLSWVLSATCSDSAKVCAIGACIDPLCKPGTVMCAAGMLNTCNADALSWSSASCEDGDGCTTDACDAPSAACTHVAASCDDGNACTTDTCSGTCQHTAKTGVVCDDNDPCTTGETCSSGTCAAPVISAAVSTVAGSGSTGGVNGPGSSASFNRPYGLTRMLDGSMIVTDYDAHRIRQVKGDGTVSTLAGSGNSGSADGAALSATFTNPTSLAVDAAGAVYIADFGNNRIRKLSGGMVSTFAGGGAGFKDGVGSAAQFNTVQDLKFDASGTLWASDRANHRIRRIAPDGTVTTAAGTGLSGSADGPVATAQFNEPCRVAPAADGSVYIADCGNYRIRKLSADGQTVSTVCGSGTGYQDGPGQTAKFAWIGGLSWLGSTLLVSDNGNNRIRAVSSDGSVSTLAGSGTAAFVDGVPSSASFYAPWNLVPDWSGAVWIADGTNQRIRKISFANLVCNDANPCTKDSCAANICTFTPLGNGQACSDGSACTSGDTCNASGQCVGAQVPCNDGNPCTTDFCNPSTGACTFPSTDAPCVDGDVCTLGDHCVGGSCISDVNTLVTVAGAQAAGYVDGPGKTARFDAPFGLALTKSGSVYVAEAGGNRIRLVAPDGTTSTAAGSGIVGYLDGAASTAQFNNPTRITLDGQGALLIADSVNNRIRKLSGQVVSTIAGSGTAGFLDGAPTSAQFNNPFGLAVGTGGVVYVADSGNHRIRSIAPDGTVGTFAGSATSGSSDGALGVATFNSPRGICQDSSGTLYVVDTAANVIRRIAGGQVSTLAGSGASGSKDGIGKAASFQQPRDCSVDLAGNVWVTDTYNNRLRRITPAGVVTTMAGSTIGAGAMLTATDGAALASVLGYPAVPAWASGGTIWVADNNAVRKFIPAKAECSDGQPCTTDQCDPVSGLCGSAPTPSGGSCDDGLVCTIGETCSGEVCANGSPNTCDDGNGCTLDSCDASTGCGHVQQFALPGCCVPNLWQTGLEGESGGITLSTTGAPAWTIGTPSKTHGGSGAMSVTSLSGTTKTTATLPSFTLPTGTTTLTFWLYYDAVPSSCNSTYGLACGSASFQVLVNGWSVFTQSTASNGWIPVTVSSALVANTAPVVTLVFTTQVNAGFGYSYAYSSGGTGVFVDDFSVTSTCK